MNKETSVIILAAGDSSRMGQPKSLLKMPSGISFLENIVRQYTDFGCSKIIIVLNKSVRKLVTIEKIALPKNVVIVINNNPEFGRFSSVKLGVNEVSSDYVFIHNVDNPIAKTIVLSQLFKNKMKSDVVIPIINNKGGHPVLLSKKVCEDILSEKANDLNLKSYLKRYSLKKVEVDDDSILININNSNELADFLSVY